jgi:hypothetical protein
MAKSPTERNKDYRDRVKLKTALLSDIDRARREDLAEQFERTTGDPELIATLREYFTRHPMCFTAPVAVNRIGRRIDMVFRPLGRDHEPAAALIALANKGYDLNLIVRDKFYDAGARFDFVRAATLTAIRAKREELIAAGLWGDTPL